MSISTVRNNYENDAYTNKMEYPKRGKLPLNHIFDEEKSVKWNREMVEAENENRTNHRKVYNEETTRLNQLFANDVIEALMEDYEFNKAQASIVYNYVYREYHSCVSDMFGYFDEVADMVSNVMNNQD